MKEGKEKGKQKDNIKVQGSNIAKEGTVMKEEKEKEKEAMNEGKKKEREEKGLRG